MTTPKRIYFDHAATTPMDQEVLEEMIPFFKEDFGNPSGAHRIAQKSQAALSRYREMAANALNSKPREIIFTSGGSESDNLAIRGIMWNARREGKGNHVVSSVAEHPAVLNTLAQLSDIYGFEKTLVGVDAKGRVDPEEIKDAVKKDTVLISLLLVSHESGAIQPIEKVAQISGDKGIPLHCDAAQAGRFLDLDVKKLGIDLLSVSGHKLYGPKGVGLLYIKEGRSLLPQITGGPQEGGIRAGTENLPLIAGFARALEICGENRQKESDQLVLLRDYLFEKIRGTLSEVKLVGELETSLPGIISLIFPGLKADTLLMRLDLDGIAASSGSACSVGNPEPSQFLIEMGFSPEEASRAVRFSFGKSNTFGEIDTLIKCLKTHYQPLKSK